MKNTPRCFFVPALLALALVSAAIVRADDSKPEKEKGPSKTDLKKYDINGDGKLDEAETAKMKADKEAAKEAREKERLAKYDANHDGKLDDAEKAKEKADKEAAKAEKKEGKHEHSGMDHSPPAGDKGHG